MPIVTIGLATLALWLAVKFVLATRPLPEERAFVRRAMHRQEAELGPSIREPHYGWTAEQARKGFKRMSKMGATLHQMSTAFGVLNTAIGTMNKVESQQERVNRAIQGIKEGNR